MLNENIRSIRKAKGLSQEELAIQLHVVRQTISKWEKGLSVPDADMLIALSAALETSVSALLGETLTEPEPDDFQALAEKLEAINLQFARGKAARRKALHWTCIALCAAIVLVLRSWPCSAALTWGGTTAPPKRWSSAWGCTHWSGCSSEWRRSPSSGASLGPA